MMVDSLTYLFNWMAERRKHTFDQYYQEPPGQRTEERSRYLQQRTKRKVILQLEILPPLISVATLLVVTGVVLREALKVIWLDLSRSVGEQSDPNIHLMMTFALVNLGLDLVNVCCFAQARHLFGYETSPPTQATTNHHHHNSNAYPHPVALDFDDYDEDVEDFWHHGHHRKNRPHEHANLNMVRRVRKNCLYAQSLSLYLASRLTLLRIP